MKTQVHTPEMLTTLEHVYLSWLVSPKSPHTVSSLSSTSVTARFCLVTTIQTAGVSRDSTKMTYWGGASVNDKCACGMNNSCTEPSYGCNCDKNDKVWREDSGLLTDRTKLPVKQLKFGDTGESWEIGFHTLGKFKCYGRA